MSLKNKYAIVGIGYTPQGKAPDRTALSFYAEAAANAIDDAGLSKSQIDGLICYRHFPPKAGEEEVTPYSVAQALGMAPKVLSQEANCARSHLPHALGVLEAGLCDYVLWVYGDNTRLGSLSPVQFYSEGAVFGHMGAVGDYALAARRAMHTQGSGPETWKEIAVAQRKWANLNPRAILGERPLNQEGYYNTKWVVEPFRLADCCLVNDGGRACIITSLERARDLPHPPVVIKGFGEHNPSCDTTHSVILDGPTGAKIAGQEALRMAGVTLDDIDACQIYDCFTYTVEITLQDYGFYGPGEGRDWFADGRAAPGGSMPVNTSGGLLSEAYFMGLTPISEGAMQLMGRCEDRQLGPATHTKTPELIMCSDNGGVLQTHTSVILGRD